MPNVGEYEIDCSFFYFLLVLIHSLNRTLDYCGQYYEIRCYSFEIDSIPYKQRKNLGESSFKSIRQNDLFHFSCESIDLYTQQCPLHMNFKLFASFTFSKSLYYAHRPIYSLSLGYLCKLLVTVLNHLDATCNLYMAMFIHSFHLFAYANLHCSLWHAYFLLKLRLKMKSHSVFHSKNPGDRLIVERLSISIVHPLFVFVLILMDST